ncbi:MAG: hypothetical protein AAAB16_03400 [Pseudomonas sp.]|uniref:hypothetical protein n=1 Tax=Pseudomonas sp. TaxID=306 RepID=UPI0030F0FB82
MRALYATALLLALTAGAVQAADQLPEAAEKNVPTVGDNAGTGVPNAVNAGTSNNPNTASPS